MKYWKLGFNEWLIVCCFSSFQECVTHTMYMASLFLMKGDAYIYSLAHNAPSYKLWSQGVWTYWTSASAGCLWLNYYIFLYFQKNIMFNTFIANWSIVFTRFHLNAHTGKCRHYLVLFPHFLFNNCISNGLINTLMSYRYLLCIMLINCIPVIWRIGIHIKISCVYSN